MDTPNESASNVFMTGLKLSDYQLTSRDFLLNTEGVAGLFDQPGV
jgi:hypothetical protein